MTAPTCPSSNPKHQLQDLPTQARALSLLTGTKPGLKSDLSPWLGAISLCWMTPEAPTLPRETLEVSLAENCSIPGPSAEGLGCQQLVAWFQYLVPEVLKKTFVQ